MISEENQKQSSIIALSITMIVIVTLSIVARVVSFFVDKKYKFGWDDVMILIAFPFVLGVPITAMILVYNGGLGQHFANVPTSQKLASQKIFLAASLTDDFALTFPKLSVVFFYHRIFQRTHPRFYFSLWILGGSIVAWGLSTVLANITLCLPPSKSWNPDVQGHCRNWYPTSLGPAIASAVIDLMILLWPMPLLFKLHATSQRKALFVGVFVVGYSVLIVSIGRVIALASIGPKAFAGDATWNIVSYVQWGQCEGPISVFCICLPRIFNLVKHLVQNTRLAGLLTSNKNNTASHTGAGGVYESRKPYPVATGLSGKFQNEEYIRLAEYGKTPAADSVGRISER